jgi:hypothetical protein
MRQITAIRYVEWVTGEGFKAGKSRFKPTELCPLALPAQGLLIFVGEDVLEHVAQADCPSEFGVAVAQLASLLALLLAKLLRQVPDHAAPRAIPSDLLLGGTVPYGP